MALPVVAACPFTVSADVLRMAGPLVRDVHGLAGRRAVELEPEHDQAEGRRQRDPDEQSNQGLNAPSQPDLSLDEVHSRSCAVQALRHGTQPAARYTLKSPPQPLLGRAHGVGVEAGEMHRHRDAQRARDSTAAPDLIAGPHCGSGGHRKFSAVPTLRGSLRNG